MGLGLSCQRVAVGNGWLKRADAAERVLTRCDTSSKAGRLSLGRTAVIRLLEVAIRFIDVFRELVEEG